eukprot:scaffold10141_cov63-Phaeocystis_antarctica.AAC.5
MDAQPAAARRARAQVLESRRRRAARLLVKDLMRVRERVATRGPAPVSRCRCRQVEACEHELHRERYARLR